MGRTTLIRSRLATGLGTFLMVWIAAQVWWLGVHWLHVLYFVLGLVELTQGLKYRKKSGYIRIKRGGHGNSMPTNIRRMR